MRKLVIPLFGVGVLLFAAALLPLTSTTTQAAQNATASPVPLVCNKVLPFIKNGAAACSNLERDEICYGNKSVSVEYADGTSPESAVFVKPGDSAPISAFKSISTTRLDLKEREMGLAIFKLQARVPGATAGQAVTFVLFGDSSLNQPAADESTATPEATAESGGNSKDNIATFPNSGAFYFTTNISEQASCKDIAPNGLVVQSPRGTKVGFSLNGAKITIGSTIFFQNQDNKSIIASVLEGQMEVEADGVTRIAKAGQMLTIPLKGGNSGATEEPNATEEANGTGGTAGAPSNSSVIPQDVQLRNCGLVRSTGLVTACVILNAKQGTPRPTRTPKPATGKPTETQQASVPVTDTPAGAGGPAPVCYIGSFGARPNPIPPGASGTYCTTVFWDVGGVESVYLNGTGVVGQGSTTVCLKKGDRVAEVLSLNCKDGTKKSARIIITTQ